MFTLTHSDISTLQGPYTREDGFLGYNEICLKLTGETDWTVEWDEHHQAPFMHRLVTGYSSTREMF